MFGMVGVQSIAGGPGGPGGSASLHAQSSFPWPIGGARQGDKSGLGARMLGSNAGWLA
jgi:hypothetical protein